MGSSLLQEKIIAEMNRKRIIFFMIGVNDSLKKIFGFN